MRRHGHMLLWAGFIGATLTSLKTGQDIDWLWYAVWMALGVAGVVILRRTAHGKAVHEHKVGADLVTMRESLAALESRLGAMLAAREETDVYAVHGAIDDAMVPDLAAFADARESMIPMWGLDRYAEVMTRFAGAERMINRAWSASADGYVDEVWSSLERAQRLMGESRALYEESMGPAS